MRRKWNRLDSKAQLSRDLYRTGRAVAEDPCGAWGGCVLPAGHNMGRADIPENHMQAEEISND